MKWLESRWYSRQAAPLYLKPLEYLYCFFADRKKKENLSKQWHPPVPLIIVGNISAGGTGKTPLTVYLIEELTKRGYRPGVVSRGYKSTASQYPFDVSLAESPEQAGDEPYMLHKRTGCPVVIDADRCAATEFLLERYDCDLVISDDGLQHYRLGRDIEIAVIDAARGLGNEHCLPAGPLREQPERLNTVDFIVCNGGECGSLPRSLESFVMTLEPTVFRSCSESLAVPVNEFKSSKINAVAGIGNPQRFFSALNAIVNNGCVDGEVEIRCHPKPDHYKFSQSDFVFEQGATTVMTEKDAVKVEGLQLSDTWYLEVAAKLPENFISAIITQLEQIEKVKGRRSNG